MKVSELIDQDLNYWVAKAEGWDFFWSKHDYWIVTKPDGLRYEASQSWTRFDPYSGSENEKPSPVEALKDFYPSSDWAVGGPIIEREKIMIDWDDDMEQWYAQLVHAARKDGVQLSSAAGATPLIAAMRTYISSKYGDEIPDEK